MCGITGIYYFDKAKKVDKQLLGNMCDSIAHRGPDENGVFLENNIGLGHRRLSIIDVAQGKQPIYDHYKNVVMVYNGEIYNYIELKKELEAKGHQFITNSDSEVIINAYLEWGIDCQEKFNGMWAFAIWDKTKNRLFISRDRIGEKPLFFGSDANGIYFGSEIKTIFETGFKKEIRTELIELYLTLTNVPTPHTFYKNIWKLKPGHCLIVDNNNVKEICYWKLPEIDENNLIKNKKKVYEKFEEIFEDAVKIRMRSDVPFGAFLSGGLDSASIVALMSKNSKFPIETFTMGFKEKAFDESHLAQLVANQYKTNHHLKTVEPETISEILKICSFHFDEPFGDSSAIPTYYISKYAREQVKMVLTGDGGDEVLSGYNSYLGIKMSESYRQLPKILQKSLPFTTSLLSKYFSGSFRYQLNKITRVTELASSPFKEQLLHKKPYTALHNIKELTKDLSNQIKVEEYFDDIFSKIPYKSDFYKLMYLNFSYDLPDDYLVKVDRMSMANAIETRAPFLDYRLIEYMIGVDKSVKMQGWERKSVLRKSQISQLLPHQLLNAPKKGFGVPLREWFKNKDTFESINMAQVKSVLNHKTIENIITENKNGERDNGNFIWTLMMLNEKL